jgi:cell division protein FtsX
MAREMRMIGSVIISIVSQSHLVVIGNAIRKNVAARHYSLAKVSLA